ncbi:MAG: hypothetical protein WBI82_00495 [Sphaerochaeta sp.]
MVILNRLKGKQGLALNPMNLFIPTGTTNEAYLNLIDCFTVIQGELG